jgi:hypothetical protein
MASIINASTAGAGGVITTADSTGILQLQTAGTTAVTIDTSQNATFAGTVAMSSSFFRNRIINGAMVIDQRNAGASKTFADSTYYVDRWVGYATQTSKGTIQQNAGSVTPPAGFTNYLGFTSSSAYSVLSTDTFIITQVIEGYNVADLAYGTSSAKTVTLSFWVRSSLTGTFGGSLYNINANKAYPYTYTISSANTWEQKTITITGDTAAALATNNTGGFSTYFSLGAGSNWTGTANTWQSGNLSQATGSQSIVGTNGATFYITGVQLEIGTSATPFERRLYNQELANCQRYYQVVGKGLNGSPAYQQFAILSYESASAAWGTMALKVTMRTQPTMVFQGPFTANYGTQGTYLSDTNQTGPDIANVGWTGGSGGTVGYSTYVRGSGTTAAYISMSAEL